MATLSDLFAGTYNDLAHRCAQLYGLAGGPHLADAYPAEYRCSIYRCLGIDFKIMEQPYMLQ